MHQGYIKLHRKIKDSPLWQSCKPERKVILITILLMANHKEKTIILDSTREKITLLPGQFVTSRSKLAKECGKGISEQMVRSALVDFQKHNFLTKESTSESTKGYTLITIKNWELYQIDSANQPSKQPKKQPSINQAPTTNKNDKNVKNNIYTSQCDELWKLYPNKKGKKDAYKKLPKLLEEYLLEELKRSVERYSKEVEGKNKQYIQHGSTFFNGGYVDYLDENFKETSHDSVKEKPKLDQYGYEII
ncbi:hypothetical protein [Terrisporobacter mayombei]|uniref:Replication protein n=2 Tax=Terrisporobacter mayombei TaxID=1541 RepID=A0ABY9Q5X4_9FIRM|nr:hypothetical protein [Terrisporobacter mayombei]MCC3868933.1 hypothetical protein [Terrisporobacter mayombei]WMT82933.1 hypothetical protein TEMA_34310 [Terrisporobacter mayombei]